MKFSKKEFCTLEELKELVRDAGIKTRNEYRFDYKTLKSKSGLEIPSTPDKGLYSKQEWNGWSNLFGTDTKLYTFVELKQLCDKLNIKTQKTYNKRYKELNNLIGDKKATSQPHVIYKNSGWTTWFDFFERKSEFYNLNDLKLRVKELKIETIDEYMMRHSELSNGNFKAPRNPNSYYSNDYTYSWYKKELNISKERNPNRIKFLTFEECKEIVKLFKIETMNQYKTNYKLLIKDGKQAPSMPNRVYSEFENWCTFLDGSTKYKILYKNAYTYEEYKKIIQNEKFKGKEDFIKGIKDMVKIDPKLVASPRGFYKNEFEGWGIFLGTGNIATKTHVYLPFEEAREWARSLKLERICDWKKMYDVLKPINIPKTPSHTYLKKGWISYYDWLGYEKNNKISHGEKLVYDYLKNININFIHDKYLKWINCKYKIRYDFYIPELKLCIEYDGELHYKMKGYYGGEEGFEKRKKLDILKNKICEDNGLNLIRLPYYLKDNEIIDILNKEFKQ